ncbi:hypothetical protein DRN69_03405 [Candidatus Pacearchaeota archaeon]|nr:MAG: hypothetical protein DRN69_03405 [Candidatus Pacearchaeota archaeon]
MSSSGKIKQLKLAKKERLDFSKERELEVRFGELFPVFGKEDYYATKFDAICVLVDKAMEFIKDFK